MCSTMLAGGPKIEQEQAKGILHVLLLGIKRRETQTIFDVVVSWKPDLCNGYSKGPEFWNISSKYELLQ